MKEESEGVKRLLNSIYNNSDENVIKILSHYLNYEENQLRQDILEIPNVKVVKK